MELADFIQDFQVKNGDVLHNTIESDGTGIRIERLSFAYNGPYGGVNELLATLGAGNVIVHRVRAEGKSKRFVFSPEEMDTLCVEWMRFRCDVYDAAVAAKVAREREQEALFERAANLCVTLICTGEDSEFAGAYTMVFAEGHAFARHWRYNTDLYYSDVLGRLEYMEEHWGKKEQAS